MNTSPNSTRELSIFGAMVAIAGLALLVVTVDGLGPGREELERRLGPLRAAGELAVEERGRLLRRYRFFRWAPAPP